MENMLKVGRSVKIRRIANDEVYDAEEMIRVHEHPGGSTSNIEGYWVNSKTGGNMNKGWVRMFAPKEIALV